MRLLRRVALPPRAEEALAAHQRALDGRVRAERRKKRPRVSAVVDAEWSACRALPELVVASTVLDAMASGLACCMYCEGGRCEDIEHHRPKSVHTEHAFRWPNMLKVCALCNRQKGRRFHADLIDPTRDDPFDHLLLAPSTGQYLARDGDSRGHETLRVLPRLTRDPQLAIGRAMAWRKLRLFLADYDAAMATGDADAAEELRTIVVNEPFSAVFAAMLRMSREPGAVDVLNDDRLDIVGILGRRPEVFRWLDDADALRVAAVMPEVSRAAATIRVRA